METCSSRSHAGLSIRIGDRTRVTRSLPEETAVAVTVNGSTHAVMMATPADLEDFSTGFALTEGIVGAPSDIVGCEIIAFETGIEARLWVVDDRARALAERRRSMAGPVGCGLCGIESLAQAVRPVPTVSTGSLAFRMTEIATATNQLRAHQPLHDRTRATHAAGFLLPEKGMVAVREDVGRHSALDKLIGGLAREGLDPATGAFVLTSRISIELVQKTAMAGCPVLIAVSAPTAHALRLAESAGITLAAFARENAYDVYSHPERILSEVPHVA